MAVSGRHVPAGHHRGDDGDAHGGAGGERSDGVPVRRGAGPRAVVVSGHVLSVALIAGVLVAIAVFAALIRFQVSTWQRAAVLPGGQ